MLDERLYSVVITFSDKPRRSALIISVYFVTTVICHDIVQDMVIWLRDQITARVLNTGITVIGSFLLAAISLYILKSTRMGSGWLSKMFYWFLTLALIAACYKVLMAVNSESAHFIQYGLLAFPLYALTRRFGETVIWATLLGAVDEGYQYWVLNRHWFIYFDFNDVVMNLAGAAITVALFYTLFDPYEHSGIAGRYSFREMISSSAFVALCAVLSSGLLLYVLGVMRFYPEQEGAGAVIVLSRAPRPTQFWTSATWASKSFHILSPIEGLLALAALFASYTFMDYEYSFREKLLTRAR